jgi:hypothetical protein
LLLRSAEIQPVFDRFVIDIFYVYPLPPELKLLRGFEH